MVKASFHPGVVLQPDSRIYVSLARGLRQHGTLCYPESPERPYGERMPGYPMILAFFSVLSAGSFLPSVIFQILLDSFSCVLIFKLTENLWEGSGWIGGLLGAGNIGMITYCNFILNDSLFLFVFLWFLLTAFHFFREPSWKWSLLMGAGLGLAVYIRPVIIYLPIFMMPFLLIYLMVGRRDSILPASGKAITLGMVFVLIISPWILRNHAHYGRYKLTSQGGEHLLQYIVPFVWQYSKGIPFIEGMKGANKAFAEKMEKEGLDAGQLGPFEKSDLQVRMAIHYLLKEPKTAILKAWAFGMAKNLFSPAVVDLSYLLQIERPHFFYTEGRTFLERAWNFVRGIQGIFGWVLIGSLFVMAIARMIQIWGLFLLFRKRKWEALFCLLIVGYFLLVSGPVGYAKYRLPFEPILIVLTAISLRDLWGKAVTRNERRPR